MNARKAVNTAVSYTHLVLNKVKKAMSIMQNEFEDFQTQIAFIFAYLEDHMR